MYCTTCGVNVEPVKKFNWIAFIFFTVFYLPVFLLKKKRCPSCRAKLVPDTSVSISNRVAIVSQPSSKRLSHDELQVVSFGIQAMESIYIIANSKALDTIQGRYNFLLGQSTSPRTENETPLSALIMASHKAGYTSLIQQSIDRFKEMHYNSTPEAYQMELVLRPQSFDIKEFYCQSLVNAFYRFAEAQIKEIEQLKRPDAKQNRALKIQSVLVQTLQEIHDNCKAAQSYVEAVERLDRLQLDIADEPLKVVALLSR